MATTQPKISKQYKGNYFIAITQFAQKYDLLGGFSKQELMWHLKDSKKRPDSDFKTLQVYNGVNNSAHNVLKRATYRLDAGKKVDLEGLLGG